MRSTGNQRVLRFRQHFCLLAYFVLVAWVTPGSHAAESVYNNVCESAVSQPSWHSGLTWSNGVVPTADTIVTIAGCTIVISVRYFTPSDLNVIHIFVLPDPNTCALAPTAKMRTRAKDIEIKNTLPGRLLCDLPSRYQNFTKTLHSNSHEFLIAIAFDAFMC